MPACKCALCGQQFEAKRSDAKYCPGCKKEADRLKDRKYKQANRELLRKRAKEYAQRHGPRPSRWKKVVHEPRVCIYCGEEFVSTRADKVSCGKRDKQHRQHEPIKTVTCNCAYCGKQFEKRQSDYNRAIRTGATEHFCSNECYAQSRYITLTCSTCGAEFIKLQSKVYGKNFVFCSRACQDANVDYILRGQDHYCYVDGATSQTRGKGWKRIRRLVRERDNYTCQVCGVTEDELGRWLDVHHIEPYRDFERSEDANVLENLILLCPS